VRLIIGSCLDSTSTMLLERKVTNKNYFSLSLRSMSPSMFKIFSSISYTN